MQASQNQMGDSLVTTGLTTRQPREELHSKKIEEIVIGINISLPLTDAKKARN